MADVSSATKFFPKAQQNSVAMTLGGSILAGAATVPINGMTNYTDNDVVVFTVDPATPSLKQVFTGTKSGSNVINCVWTEVPTGGVNVPHSAGATVIDYVTATHWDLNQKGITSSLNQDGSLITAAVQTALNISTPATSGWTISGFAPSAVVCNGNRSYTLTFAATNLTTTMSPGMRIQTTRTVAAPTQCTSLNGTTQYYSKATPAGSSFTNNFVNGWWVKPSSYAVGTIASIYNGTSGWALRMNASGQIQMIGYNAGAANFSQVLSYQSIPLNKWTHVAAQLDMATFTATTTTSYVMIDGVDVPAAVSRGGTNPTALIQAGNLNIGAENGGTSPFPGKIANGGFFSAKVTQATMLSYISQGLAGTETSLISAYSFNNSINDLNANANNLTANGSAVATNADSPFGGQADGAISSTLDYAEVVSASFSTNTTLTVRVPDGNTIPTSGGVSAVSYSTVAYPYGFPAMSNVIAYVPILTSTTTTTGSLAQFLGLSTTVTVPLGRKIKITAHTGQATTVATANTFTMSICNGAVTSGNVVAYAIHTASGAGDVDHLDAIAYIDTSTTSYTFNVATSDDGVRETISGSTTSPTFLVVEYCGP